MASIWSRPQWVMEYWIYDKIFTIFIRRKGIKSMETRPCCSKPQSTCWQSTHWNRDKMTAILQTNLFKCIFLNEIVWISNKISLKFFPQEIPALVQVMAWHRSGDKPLSEPIMVRLLTHICVTRPQWVNVSCYFTNIHIQDINYMHTFSMWDWWRKYSQTMDRNHRLFTRLPVT